MAPGQPVTVSLTLEVGDLTETVTVTSSAELINTETATVAATLNADQLNRMPTPTRNALNAITFLPGVNQTGVNRDATINGLPSSFLSITLDGVSNNDNFNRSTRRLLRLGDAAPGRGRGRRRHAGRRRRPGGRRVRVGDDGVPDPVGEQPVLGQRLRVLARSRAEHELLLQPGQQPPEERGEAEPVRRACGRPDRRFPACSTAATRRSSSSTTSSSATRTASRARGPC